MNNFSDSDLIIHSVELKVKPAQVALAGIILLAGFGAALLLLRLMGVLILVFVALVIAATLRPTEAETEPQGQKESG